MGLYSSRVITVGNRLKIMFQKECYSVMDSKPEVDFNEVARSHSHSLLSVQLRLWFRHDTRDSHLYFPCESAGLNMVNIPLYCVFSLHFYPNFLSLAFVS